MEPALSDPKRAPDLHQALRIMIVMPLLAFGLAVAAHAQQMPAVQTPQDKSSDSPPPPNLELRYQTPEEQLKYQTPDNPKAQIQKPPQPSEITIGPSGEAAASGSSATGQGTDRCVDVQIGTSRAYDCLNRKLKDQVDRVNPGTVTVPATAASPDLQIGVVNIPAVQQQYGKSFGTSVYPYRPPPLIYNIPTRGR